jgi:hypothetical protein
MHYLGCPSWLGCLVIECVHYHEIGGSTRVRRVCCPALCDKSLGARLGGVRFKPLSGAFLRLQ